MIKQLFMRLLVVVAVSVAVLVYIALGNSPSRSMLQAEYAWEVEDSVGARPQDVKSRIWQEYFADKIFTVGGDSSDLLYGLLHLKVDSRDHLFVIDYGDLGIKEFSSEGVFLRKYGVGRGQGPGEFGAINDFDFISSEMWVADDSNGRIVVFDLEGNLLRTIKMDPRPYRLAGLDNGSFVMMRPLGYNDLFEVFSQPGDSLGEFGRFLKDQEHYPLILDGWIESSAGDGFVYAGKFASLIAGYHATGELRFLVESIDPGPLPRLIRADEDRMWVEREARDSALSLSVTAKEIHVLTSIPSGLKQKGVIDTYDARDGSYLYSRRLPEPCFRVFVTEDHIYTVKETAVTKWSLVM